MASCGIGVRKWMPLYRHRPALSGTFYRSSSTQSPMPHRKKRMQAHDELQENYSLTRSILHLQSIHRAISYRTAPILHQDYNAHFSISLFTSRRYLNTSSVCFDKSKVEDSLKEKEKKKQKDADSSETTSERPSSIGHGSNAAEKKQGEISPQPKKPLWQRFKAEVLHYYHGFRLMALDIRIASKTLWKILKGKSLTRRESNQFKRAVSDIFRLAPFMVFVIIPFAELALPIVVRLFPRMLPSTFEDKSTRDARLKRELTVKLEMAKFMQGTVEDIAMRSKKSSQQNKATQDFANFFRKIRTSDEDPTNDDILKHAKLFEDELTLDSMTRPQLIALCRLIQVPAVGSNNLLRFLLKLKLRRLHMDDEVIQREGIENLTVQELQTACQARGMRALGMSETRLKQQLQQWIDLHLKQDVPSSLLLLSRVLFMPATVPVEKLVKEAISSLPDKVADEAEVRAAELNCERIDNTTRYKATKQELLDITKEEKEEKQKEKEKKIKQKQEKKKQEELAAVESVSHPADMKDAIVTEESFDVDTAPVLKDKAQMFAEGDAEQIPEGPIMVDKAPVVEEITKEEIDVLDKAIDSIKKDDSLKKAKSELEDLKEDLVEYQQDVISLDENLAFEKDEIVNKEKKASDRLQSKITRFISEIDSIVEELERRKTSENGESDEKQSISVEKLKDTLRALGNIHEDKLSSIVDVLDANKDGEIDLEEALLAIKALDSEDVSVTSEQLHQLVCMVQDKNEEGTTEKSC